MTTEEKFGTIFFIVLLSIIMLIINKHDIKNQEKISMQWNNGYCIECQGAGEGVLNKYHLTSSYCIGNGTPTYIYTCPACGHAVETKELKEK